MAFTADMLPPWQMKEIIATQEAEIATLKAELARRGAAAGELLEASKEILGMAEGYLNIMPDRHGTRIAKLAAARAAIAQFEATAATQETRNVNS